MRNTILLSLLLLVSGNSLAQEVSKITIFREKQPSPISWKNTFKLHSPLDDNSKTDDASPSYIWKILIDGKETIGINAGSFATISLPPGRHEIRTKYSERLILDLHPGDHLYIRPRFTTAGLKGWHAKDIIEQVTCKKAKEASLTVRPIPEKRIYLGEIEKEKDMPISCPKESSAVRKMPTPMCPSGKPYTPLLEISVAYAPVPQCPMVECPTSPLSH